MYMYCTAGKVHVYASVNVIKIVNSLLAIFDKIWPKTLYYTFTVVQEFWPDF